MVGYRGGTTMKTRVAVAAALALASFHIPALAAEKGGKQPAPMKPELFAALATVMNKAGEMCKDLAVELKDIEFFNYCWVGMTGPYFQGPNCTAVLAGMKDPNIHCDSKGTMYYEPPGPALHAVMNEDDLEYAFKKIVSKHSNRERVACIVNNGSDADIAACLSKGGERFVQIVKACYDTKFNADRHDHWLRAVDLCIEYKLKP
jgi:hypothetical protein